MTNSPTHVHLDLQAEAADLVRALGGAWRPQGAMCRCPAHPDRTPSLSVRVGARSLLFKCFAGCTGVEIMQAIRRLKLRIPTVRDAALDTGTATDMALAMSARAQEIWRSARRVEGSRAEAYLAARGIRRLSAALRYHPRTPIGRGRAACFRPALIAAISEGGAVIAIQRLFLDPDRPALAADLARPKLMLGRPRSGAVMLEPPNLHLGLAEGVESAMSAAILLGIPVWAVLGNERLSRIAIPASVRRLILLPDNDRAGRLAESRARDAHARAGLAVETVWPWAGLNDWNDVLHSEGKEEGGRMRLAI
jgi:putative DNA primase/helicase